MCGAVAAVEATVRVDRWHWFQGWCGNGSCTQGRRTGALGDMHDVV